MTTYGNLRTANEDKIKLSGGSQLGGPVHQAKTDGTHRTHSLGGSIAKPKEMVKLSGGRPLGGNPGPGCITDCYGTTPMKTTGGSVGGNVGS